MPMFNFGKNINANVDYDRLGVPANLNPVVQYLVEYGIKQKGSDVHASLTLKDSKDGTPASDPTGELSRKAVLETIDGWYAGRVDGIRKMTITKDEAAAMLNESDLEAALAKIRADKKKKSA